MIDLLSEAGSYAEALLYPPYAGATDADGTFRRGFPEGDQSIHDNGR